MSDEAQDLVADVLPGGRLSGRNPDGTVRAGMPSLNPSGRPKSKPFTDAIKKHFAENPDDLTAIVKDLVSAAKGEQTSRFGEVVNQHQAAGFLRDSLQGRPKQEIELTGDEEGGPVRLLLSVVEEATSDAGLHTPDTV